MAHSTLTVVRGLRRTAWVLTGLAGLGYLLALGFAVWESPAWNQSKTTAWDHLSEGSKAFEVEEVLGKDLASSYADYAKPLSIPPPGFVPDDPKTGEPCQQKGSPHSTD